MRLFISGVNFRENVEFWKNL